jgi:hypothetical protein
MKRKIKERWSARASLDENGGNLFETGPTEADDLQTTPVQKR